MQMCFHPVYSFMHQVIYILVAHKNFQRGKTKWNEISGIQNTSVLGNLYIYCYVKVISNSEHGV